MNKKTIIPNLKFYLFLLFLILLLFACRDRRMSALTPVYTYKVVKVYPHDNTAFTQGLVFEDGFLYEGTGLYRRSSLRKVNLDSGAVLKQRKQPDEFFCEGITIFDDKIYQLTLHAGQAFVFDKNSFELLRTFSYTGQGWGLTHDSANLIMSDGSATLRLLDPNSFEQIGSIYVTDYNHPVVGLNELEYIEGEIYANIWLTDRIARISPSTGRVTSYIDLTNILPLFAPNARGTDVLNGIAYDRDKKRLFVTGKLWPILFHIKLVSK